MSLVAKAVVVLAGTTVAGFGLAGPAAAADTLHGAISLSDSTGTVASAVNYSDPAAADAAANQHCGRADCRVVLHFTDGCGAVAQGVDRRVAVGWGPTQAEAEKQARDVLGLSAPPFPDLGSASPRPATIVLHACTANAA
ncbi:DUF4189 domain-containing protein [Nocardia blacklockiae]|uniref:DUF4189 domain-containing protein n=1 Tax=Nocardia blacklockiae TaxID=480036 RepID=UPI00189499E1|nr:DUF4189 domain-containing protein [Nocardia blacklockiae]MBF6176660.1 DUF4189 domain-containing protein [Nocardia blacklockiae]